MLGGAASCLAIAPQRLGVVLRFEILAKFHFVLANALIVFQITRSTAASLLVSASTAFIWFFLFRINHAGFFHFVMGHGFYWLGLSSAI